MESSQATSQVSARLAVINRADNMENTLDPAKNTMRSGHSGHSASSSTSDQKWKGLQLRTVIVLQVFANVALVAILLTGVAFSFMRSTNIDAIDQGTSSIKTLARTIQRETSRVLMSRLQNYLTMCDAYGNSTAAMLSADKGALDPTDPDTIIPWMKRNLVALNIEISFVHFGNNQTLDDFGTGIIPDSVGNIALTPGTRKYWLVYATQTVRRSCRVCPVVTTSTNQTFWQLNDDMTPGPFGYQVGPGWTFKTRPWWTAADGRPLGSPVMTEPYLSTAGTSVKLISQSLSYPLWYPNNTYLGVLSIVIPASVMSRFLDASQASATPNTLIYLIGQKGEVLGRSGALANGSDLIKTVGSTTTIKTIWDYDLSTFPLLNISASTIFTQSGGNLASLSGENSFASQGEQYLFQYSTYSQSGYQWILVSGAPATDYLANTLELQGHLGERLFIMSVILIIIALLLLLILGPVALIFTELFISRPINCMIDAMEKATRMDFSDVRTGVREPHSLVLEVSNIQSVFIKMLKTFADVLRGGKNTLNKNPVSAAPSVVARTFQSRLEPTTPTHLLSAGDGVGRESDAESGWAMSRSGAVESTVMSSRIERIDE